MDSGVKLSQFEAVANKAVASGALPGVAAMVADQNDVLYSAAFGVADVTTGAPLRLDDVFFIASMTKIITALACVHLIEQGKLGSRMTPPRSRQGWWRRC